MTPTIIECGSGIERVVVYARGAVVTRRVALPETLPDEPLELRIPGVTARADAGSVRALCDGEREVTALSARLSLPETKVERGALAERIRALDLDRRRIEAEHESLASLKIALTAARLDPGISRWAKRIDPAARFADATAVSGLVDAEIARLDGRIADLDRALEENARARTAAEIAAAQGTPAETEGDRRALLEVRVRLAAGAGKVGALAIEYVVGAARWWPAYTARFTAAATKVALTLDAFVAQASGEDWSRVRLALSTAHLAHDARLPELRSLRLGRAQPAPKRGYRPPPEGLDALFEGYDRAASEIAGPRVETRTALPAPAAKPAPADSGDLVDALAEATFEEATIAPAYDRGELARRSAAPSPARAGGYAAPPGGGGYGAPPTPTAALQAAPSFGPPQSMSRAAAPPRAKKARLGRSIVEKMAELEAALDEDEGGGMLVGLAGGETTPPPIEPGDAWLDFDALVLADPADRTYRGRLVRRPGAGTGVEAATARRRIESVTAPPLARDPLAARGRFDHRYDAEGSADVPASGRPHRVAVGAAETSAATRFVAVPREAAEVYREVEIKNPFDAPLLAGPVDVFLDGALMTTSELSLVDRNGTMHLGLGVEDRLRVARNARVDESTAGLLGGSLVVDHAVTVDIASSLGRKVEVDVVERVPVTDEKDVDVKLTYTRPEGEKYTQVDRGAPLRRAYRFRVAVPAGDKAKIEFGYRVTLPAKNEIIGGNRRE